MAFNFPNTPVDGEVFTPPGDAPTYVWRAASTVWELQTGGANTAFVAKTGDIMTGNLTVSNVGPVLYLNRTSGTSFAAISGRQNNLNRWLIYPGIGTAADDFGIARCDDLGATYSGYLIRGVRATGQVSIEATLASSSATSGALIVAGGVGINGAANIAGALGVTGAITMGNSSKVLSTSTIASLYLQNSTSGSTVPTDGLLLQSNGLNTYVYNLENGFMAFATNNTERLRIAANGDVNITSTTVSGLVTTGALVVAGGVGVGGQIVTQDLWIAKGGAGAGLNINKTATSGQISCITGNVLVGSNLARWRMDLGDTATEAGGNLGSDFALHRYSDTAVFLQTALHIARNTGDVWIQSTTQSSSKTTGALKVTGGVGVQGFIYSHVLRVGQGNFTGELGSIMVAYAGAGIEWGMSMRGQHGSDTGTAIGFQTASGSNVGSIYTDAIATYYVESSDERLKADFRSFDAGAIIDSTFVYDFEWKKTGQRRHGIVAQEAHEVYPAAIIHRETDDWWGVDYSKYVPVLLQEVKSLRARVAQLEA